MHLLHSIYTYEKKRTKNTKMNTRQQTMNTPDDILSDKIKEDTDLNMHQS